VKLSDYAEARGLMWTRWTHEELEACYRAELKAISVTRMLRMLIIAVHLCSAFAFVGESLFRNMFRVNLARSGRAIERSGGGSGGACSS